jgi:hypothetical protein
VSLLREAGFHLAARTTSALASSAVFALLARLNSPADAKAIFFFLFASGFLAAFLRSFCMISAGLQGGQSRSAKLRRVRTMARHYLRLSPAFAVLCVLVLMAQAVELWVIAATTVTIVAAGFNGDLLRAAIGRSAHFAGSFAIGNLAALVWLLLGAKGGVNAGVVAVLLPWVALAVPNASIAVRLSRNAAWRRRRIAVQQTQAGRHWPSAILTALYDGTVLNFPFIVGARLTDSAGLELSVVLRLFSSAQPFFPLVMHWAASGQLTRMGRRSGIVEPVLYGMLLTASGLAASLLFALIFFYVGGQHIMVRHYGLFVCLLLAFSLFATAVQFVAPELADVTRSRQVAVLLMVFVAFWMLCAPWLKQFSAATIGWQCVALIAMALSTWILRRIKQGAAQPNK